MADPYSKSRLRAMTLRMYGGVQYQEKDEAIIRQPAATPMLLVSGELDRGGLLRQYDLCPLLPYR